MIEKNNRAERTILDEEAEGGLRPPPGLSFWRRVWWWFDFLILVKLARLRFIGILVVIGLVIVYWDTLAAYYDKWTRPASVARATASDVEYFCPMHPSVIRDNPKDKCPICFMPLSKRKKGEATAEVLPPGIVNRVQLSPYRVVLGGIRTWKVDYVPLSKKISTVGSVEFNERQFKQVAARVKGRIDTLVVNETGQMVRAGDEMGCLYSPDLVVTVQNLLDAKRGNNADLLRIARERLQLWGITDGQIDTMLRTGKAYTHVKIHSPIDGHVIKKYVKEGQYVDEGTPLFDVADLATVWIEAQIYEDDIAFLPPQEQFNKKTLDKKHELLMTATSRSFPNERFEGALTFVYPHVDQDTRTVTVRFELDNPGHKLRPGATATVELEVPASRLALFTTSLAESWAKENTADMMAHGLSPAGPMVVGVFPLLQSAGRYVLLQKGDVLAVPDGAVIDTGSQQIVYREVLPGDYEGVKVDLGPRMSGPDGIDFYPVMRGLEWGDRVVTAGSFLVDAETRLNPAAGSIYFGGTGLNKAGPSSTTPIRPTTPDDEDAKIKAALAKLGPADRALAEAQGFCPIQQDSRLGSMGPPVKIMIRGKPVFLC